MSMYKKLNISWNINEREREDIRSIWDGTHIPRIVYTVYPVYFFGSKSPGLVASARAFKSRTLPRFQFLHYFKKKKKKGDKTHDILFKRFLLRDPPKSGRLYPRKYLSLSSRVIPMKIQKNKRSSDGRREIRFRSAIVVANSCSELIEWMGFFPGMWKWSHLKSKQQPKHALLQHVSHWSEMKRNSENKRRFFRPTNIIQ